MNGTIYSLVKKVFDNYDFYYRYRKGEISKEDYVRLLDCHKDQLLSYDIFTPWLHNTIKRLPLNDNEPSVDLFDRMYSKGYISDTKLYEDEFNSFYEKYIQGYNHGGYRTYIFPEEERIAFYLTNKIKPLYVFSAGSYYGYWNSFILPSLKKDSKMILSDIDSQALDLSKENYINIPYKGQVLYENSDSEKLLLRDSESIDLLVLDATGSRDDNRPQYRGKSIYAPFVRAALPRMKKGSILLAHNIYRDDKELEHFFKIVDDEYSFKCELNTTCGAALYIR